MQRCEFLVSRCVRTWFWPAPRFLVPHIDTLWDAIFVFPRALPCWVTTHS